MNRKPAVTTAILAMLMGWPAWGQANPSHQAVGASVEELLALAQSMNPELAAAALESAAAQAQVVGVDNLPDPKFKVTLDDISKNNSGVPERVGMVKYTLSQEIPWWGKRAAQREIAQAGSREAAGMEEEQIAQVVMKVKIAYADYHRVHLSMDQTDELVQIMRTLVEFARFRYAQGMGLQQEATTAEAERGAMSVERVRLEKERARIRARLNTLVNRPANAPLVEHPHLRPIPPKSALNFQSLLERGLAANPSLHISQARLARAEGEVAAAEQAWYPNVEVGLTYVNRRDPMMDNGYEAMVGLNLPLRWERRNALELSASLKKQAAQERLHNQHLQVESGLYEALLSLEESRQVEQVTRDSLIPQARIALQSSLSGYETGTIEAMAVLDAVQRLKKFQIDLLKAEYEQQVRMAEIERFIGGGL